MSGAEEVDVNRDLAEMASPALQEFQAEIEQEYNDLRTKLHLERDSTEVAAILLELSDRRVTLDRVREEAARRVEEHEPRQVGREPEQGPTVKTDAETGVAAAPPPTNLAAKPVTGGRAQVAHPTRAAPFEIPPLTLRFLFEGPPEAGTSTVVGQLSEQFRSDHQRSTIQEGEVTVHWHGFEAGLFDGRPIGFQALWLHGRPDRAARRKVRAMVDAIIVVTDSSPEGLATAKPYLGEVLDDQRDIPADERPEVSVFANKSDLETAAKTDVVARELLVESSIGLVSTNSQQGYLYGFALSTNAALKRLQRRDNAGLLRTERIELEALLVMLGADRGSEATVVLDSANAVPKISSVVPEIVRVVPDVAKVEPVLEQTKSGSDTASQGRAVAEGTPIAAQSEPRKRVQGRHRASALRKLIGALRNPE